MKKFAVYKLTEQSTGLTVVVNFLDDDAIVLDMLDEDPSELDDMLAGLDQTLCIAAVQTADKSIDSRYAFVMDFKTIPISRLESEYKAVGVLNEECQKSLLETIAGVIGFSTKKTMWDTEKKFSFVSDFKKYGVDYVVEKYHIQKASAYKYNKRFRAELKRLGLIGGNF